MFGVTTPCVQQIAAALAADWECLVFHATGVGGRSMEKLVDSGFISGVIDITTTEVADLLMGGVLPAGEDRFGAIIRTRDALCRLGRRARHGQFRPAGHRAGRLQGPPPPRAQSAGDAHAHDRGGERPDRPLDRRAAEPHGRAGALLPARTWRLGARRAGPGVPGPAGRRRAVPRARTDGAPDREPAADPGQAAHQRSRIFRRRCRRVSRATRPDSARRRAAR